MIKYRSNKTLLLFLITAFLTVQWSVTHVHLAEHHDHNGSHHQHNIQAHTHYASSHHADTIDSAHATDDYNIVDLNNACASPGWKKLDDHAIVSTSVVHQFLFIPQSTSIHLFELDRNKRSYVAYSTIRLRAPPQFS